MPRMEGLMTYNETETRFELIELVLREMGYRQWRIRLETPAPVESLGYKGRRRAGSGRTDYLLCVQLEEWPPSPSMPAPANMSRARS
jgi:type I restriction enzyme R subunit